MNIENNHGTESLSENIAVLEDKQLIQHQRKNFNFQNKEGHSSQQKDSKIIYESSDEVQKNKTGVTGNNRNQVLKTNDISKQDTTSNKRYSNRSSNNSHKKYSAMARKNLLRQLTSVSKAQRILMEYNIYKSSRIYYFCMLISVRIQLKAKEFKKFARNFVKEIKQKIIKYQTEIQKSHNSKLIDFRKQEIQDMRIAMLSFKLFFSKSIQEGIQCLYKKNKGLILKPYQYKRTLSVIQQIQNRKPLKQYNFEIEKYINTQIQKKIKNISITLPQTPKFIPIDKITAQTSQYDGIIEQQSESQENQNNDLECSQNQIQNKIVINQQKHEMNGSTSTGQEGLSIKKQMPNLYMDPSQMNMIYSCQNFYQQNPFTYIDSSKFSITPQIFSNNLNYSQIGKFIDIQGQMRESYINEQMIKESHNNNFLKTNKFDNANDPTRDDEVELQIAYKEYPNANIYRYQYMYQNPYLNYFQPNFWHNANPHQFTQGPNFHYNPINYAQLSQWSDVKEQMIENNKILEIGKESSKNDMIPQTKKVDNGNLPTELGQPGEKIDFSIIDNRHNPKDKTAKSQFQDQDVNSQKFNNVQNKQDYNPHLQKILAHQRNKMQGPPTKYQKNPQNLADT